jgi:N-acetylglucosaminyldiphosphoundecaprenol N-acetyl-beta-D-mannosaminyltransferase
MPPPRIDLLGLPLHALTEREVLTLLAQRLDARQGTWVITPNLDILRQYTKYPELRPLFHAEHGGADVLLPDGMPLIWASRIAGHSPPLPQRVAGSTLVLSLAHLAGSRGWRLFLLGGAPGDAERAAAVLQSRHKDLVIAGTFCPPLGFEKDPRQLQEIEDKLVAAQPDLVYVALGFPKQELLTQQIRHCLPNATFIGVGISLSFIAGTVRRAPRWVQGLGLEWVHRLIQEPRRLAKRYLVHDLPFALFTLFPRALIAQRRGFGASASVIREYATRPKGRGRPAPSTHGNTDT